MGRLGVSAFMEPSRHVSACRGGGSDLPGEEGDDRRQRKQRDLNLNGRGEDGQRSVARREGAIVAEEQHPLDEGAKSSTKAKNTKNKVASR